MKNYVVLKLQGPMQAWGEHSFEGLRPSSYVPTRSSVLGLLGACMGIRREEKNKQKELAERIAMAVRVDRRVSPERSGSFLTQQKLTDYHTIKDARENYRGLKRHETIQTWREYILDSEFTVAVWMRESDSTLLEKLEQAVRFPIYTPYLGRRSCPLARPLFEKKIIAANEFAALETVAPPGGEIYSETPGQVRSLKVRDVPITNLKRQFASRIVYVYGGGHVSE